MSNVDGINEWSHILLVYIHVNEIKSHRTCFEPLGYPRLPAGGGLWCLPGAWSVGRGSPWCSRWPRRHPAGPTDWLRLTTLGRISRQAEEEILSQIYRHSVLQNRIFSLRDIFLFLLFKIFSMLKYFVKLWSKSQYNIWAFIHGLQFALRPQDCQKRFDFSPKQQLYMLSLDSVERQGWLKTGRWRPFCSRLEFTPEHIWDLDQGLAITKFGWYCTKVVSGRRQTYVKTWRTSDEKQIAIGWAFVWTLAAVSWNFPNFGSFLTSILHKKSFTQDQKNAKLGNIFLSTNYGFLWKILS